METNKIYFGDAYELIKNIPSKSVDLIMTDPPYDIQGIHGAGIMKTRKKGNFSQEIKDANLDIGIDLSILDDFVRVMKKINIYIWCNKSQILPYLKYFVDNKKCSFEILVWIKENPIPFCGTHYLCDKEYCLYFWEQGAPVNIAIDRAKTYYISKTNREDKNNFEHPTIKPIDLIEKLIANSTNLVGELKKEIVVFDPFVGSGTTCLAAKHLGLSYIGFEINENYYKIACDRLQGINAKGEMNLFDL